MIKKLLCRMACALLIFSVIAQTTPIKLTVGAQNSVSDKVMFDLKAYGIIEGDENGDFGFDKQMTRAEFATVIVRMLQLDTINAGSTFQDVTSDQWFAPSVSTIVSLGVLNGYPDGTFRPDNNISQDEAIKILVSILGYSYQAQLSGGYPTGYIAVAQKLGLYKNVSGNNPPKKADLYNMFYNTLDVDMMVKIMGSEERYEVSDGQTLRSQFEDMDYRDESYQKGRGIVTANYYYYLISPISNIKKNQVQIDGVLYDTGNTNAADYIGQEVDFYVRENEDGDYTMVNIKPTKNVRIVTITDDTYLSTDWNTVYYQAEDGDTEEADIADDLIYILNGELQASYVASDIKTETGELVLIDNDGDEKADVAIRSEYTNVVADSVKGNRIFFKSGQKNLNKEQIIIDLEDDSKKFILQDKDGKEVKVEDIKEGNVLSIMSDKAGDFNKIIVSDTVIEGKIDEIINDTSKAIVVDGEEYKIAKNADVDVTLGDEAVIYLNFKNQVADYEITVREERYAYVYSYEDKGMDRFMLNLIIPGTMTVEYDIDDSDPDKIVKTPYLKARNSAAKTYQLAGKARIFDEYGVKTTIETFLQNNRIIKYQLNEDGLVSRIEAPKRMGSVGDRVYNGYERTFGKKGIGAFGTDDKTNVICVPSNLINSTEDFFARVDITNDQEYAINGYDVQEDYTAKLAVITMTMNSKSVVEINSKSKIAVVSKITQVLNEDKNAVTQMSFFSDGAEKSYRIGETADAVARTMSFGDVFYYTLNPLEEIGMIKVVGKCKTSPVMYNEGNYNTEKTIFGRIDNIDYKVLNDINNKYIDTLKIVFDKSGTDYFNVETDVRNTPAIYLVNVRNKTVKVGSREDLLPVSSGDNEYIFAHVTSSKIRGIVLYTY